MASAAGADDEGADALERREPLVVVVVAGEDDVGTAAAERRPERAEGGVRAVQAGAEARVMHVRDRAAGRIRGEIRGEPALLRRAALAAAGGAAVGVQDDDVPVAEVVGVVAASAGGGSRRSQPSALPVPYSWLPSAARVRPRNRPHE